MALYTKWIYYDEPLHAKVTTCTIDKCNVTSTTCYHKCYGCGLTPFICYAFNVTITLLLDNQNYTQTINSDYNTSGYYPIICNGNTTECDYDNRDIECTLTVYKINLIGMGYYGWALMIFMTLLVTAGLYMWSNSLKMNKEYETIKDDMKIEATKQKV